MWGRLRQTNHDEQTGAFVCANMCWLLLKHCKKGEELQQEQKQQQRLKYSQYGTELSTQAFMIRSELWQVLILE